MGDTLTKFAFRAHGLGAVDVEQGLISDVAVITEGPAKGHFDWMSNKPLHVDATTLRQVMECAASYRGGLKVKMDHFSGVTEIVGSLRDFSVSGTVLRANLRLLKSTKHRDYVVEIAQEIPDTFGISIVFSGPAEVIGEKAFARCVEIYSADLVSEPAANPSGLFEAKPASAPGDKPGLTKNNQPNSEMSDENKIQALENTVTELKQVVDGLVAQTWKLEEAKPTEQPKIDFAAKIKEAADAAAEAALTKFAEKFGAPPPAKPSSEEQRREQEQPKTFEELVKAHPKYAENKAFAIREIAAANPQAHRDYLGRLHGGEVRVF